MSIGILLLLAAFSVFVGALIGAVGVGGVLLVPFLTYVAGLGVHIAIAAAMFAYIFAGATGAILYARRGSIRWSMAGWLILGATPAAFLGAMTLFATPGRLLELGIAGLLLFAGFDALRPARVRRVAAAPGPLALIAIGAVTGFGSAMTGTGGPLILVPVLVWLGLPTLTAVGLSQAVQLPLAALATTGNLLYGRVDFVVGGAIAAALIAGVAIGARLAHAMTPATLRRVVAWVIVSVGLFIVARIVTAAVTGAP